MIFSLTLSRFSEESESELWELLLDFFLTGFARDLFFLSLEVSEDFRFFGFGFFFYFAFRSSEELEDELLSEPLDEDDDHFFLGGGFLTGFLSFLGFGSSSFSSAFLTGFGFFFFASSGELDSELDPDPESDPELELLELFFLTGFFLAGGFDSSYFSTFGSFCFGSEFFFSAGLSFLSFDLVFGFSFSSSSLDSLFSWEEEEEDFFDTFFLLPFGSLSFSFSKGLLELDSSDFYSSFYFYFSIKESLDYSFNISTCLSSSSSSPSYS